MTLEEYKALAAKAAAGDQEALLKLSQFGEQAIATIAESAKAVETAKQETAKVREENAKILISMFTGPATPVKNDSGKTSIPTFQDENGFPLRSTEYAAKFAETEMENLFKEEKTDGSV